MDSRALAFMGMAAVLMVIPGADMALITRNALRGGFRTAWLTTLGISLGVAVHATASALGLSAILHTSPTAFTVVKVAGAIYLAYLGAQTLRESARAPLRGTATPVARAQPGGQSEGAPTRAFMQGLVTNVLNPKVALFYVTMLPQFIGPSDPVLRRSLLLAGLHIAMGLVWLSTYAYFITRLGTVFTRPRVKQNLERLMGSMLIALGVRLAWARR